MINVYMDALDVSRMSPGNGSLEKSEVFIDGQQISSILKANWHF
jgi:hypothetical protein